MINIKAKSDCCGCTACANICGQHAISMVEDGLGFKYPIVNSDACSNCGLCESVCSFNDAYQTKDNLEQPIPFGARNKDKNEMSTSRSGGVFPELAKWMIRNKGIVYGAGFSDDFSVVHKRAETWEQCLDFKGSKYVQSDLKDVFKQVKADLDNQHSVLFSGTPCQIAGLKSFVGNSAATLLYTIDIVCHGVPSPKIWHDYIEWQAKRNKLPIRKVVFRDKKYGWFSHIESLQFINGQIKYTDVFSNLYYKHIMLRPSCGYCKFCNLHRPGDISLADFWGWEKTDAKFNLDDQGVSLVLCNTLKGKQLFEEVIGHFDIINPKLSDCMQGHLLFPTVLNPLSSEFANDYYQNGFEYVLRKYGEISITQKCRKLMGRLKRSLVRRAKMIWR